MVPLIDLGVENLGDLKLLFSVDSDWRGRRLDAIGNGVRRSRFKLRHMEDGVNGSHGVGKSEGVGVGADLGNHFEGAKILFGELLGGSGCPEEVGFDVGLASNLKVWSRSLLQISVVLITFLGFSDLFPEFDVKFVQVYC
jgi:hypothetical protein